MAEEENSLNERSTISWPHVGLFTFTRIVLSTSIRMVYPFLAVFARGIGVSVEQFSLALSTRSLVSTAAPVLAPISDRFGCRTGMALGLGIFTVGMGWITFFPSFAGLIAALSLGLLGVNIFISAMQSYLGQQVAYQQRGRVMAVTELGWSLSYILGMPLVGVLLSGGGWRAPFAALAGLGAAMLILLLRILPDTQPRSTSVPNLINPLRTVLTTPAAVAGLVMGMCISGANEMVNVMFGVWMEGSFGLKIAGLGAAAAVIGLSELSGEGGSAALVDRLGKERSVRIGLLLAALAAGLLPFLGQLGLVGALIGLFLFYLTFEFTLVSSLPLISQVLPAARATLMSLNFAAYSAGRALADLAAPYLFRQSFYWNAAASVALYLLAVLLLSRVKIQSENEPRGE